MPVVPGTSREQIIAGAIRDSQILISGSNESSVQWTVPWDRIVMAGIGGCTSMNGAQRAMNQHGQREDAQAYCVSRLRAPMTIDANWDKAAWAKIQPIELTHFMGQRPAHFPRTQMKLAYHDRFIYAIFRVEDRYVRAVARHHQDAVCHDSCVEFFFVPGADTVAGYFNLEMNCGGTMLFHFQVIPRKDVVSVKDSDIERIEVAQTMPRTVEPEIADPTTWTVEYRLPTDLLARYCPTAREPAPGVVWRANVYKCADETSHPHWLTWAAVENPRPDFHLPQYFGRLIFE